MEQLALTVPLTKLKNRRATANNLEKALEITARSDASLSVILSDIDHFKSFNDNYRHDCRDLILKSVSEKLQMLVRSQDTVGRWGGEEFIIILLNTDAHGAIRLAETLKHHVESSHFAYQIEGHEKSLNVTMTFGVAEFHLKMDTLKSLINQADKMLYVGKAQGRSCVIYRPK